MTQRTEKKVLKETKKIKPDAEVICIMGVEISAQ